VKLIVREPESRDLQAWITAPPWRVSCTLARVEVPRAVKVSQPDSVSLVAQVLSNVDLITLTDELFLDAADLPRPALQSLDAIHLAAARTLGDSLKYLVTYDRRMTEAAEAVGLSAIAPGR
jgi:predicted nucleic acid-binding protein